MPQIGLGEVIAQLRAELSEAIAARSADAIQFPVENVTVSFQVGVTKEGDGGGKLRLHVLELSASGKYSRETIQTVNVELGRPVDPYGRQISVNQTSTSKPG